MADPVLCLHVEISGRVQGVGYRAWLAGKARAHGLAGWVRNRRDGRVEALLRGPRPAVETVESMLWRGPAAARVSAVESQVSDEAAEGFEVRPTA